jgi:hypothetical protein
MIIEACRLVTDWLNDGTNGVNAMLAIIPMDAGDSAPAAIAAGSIVDATRDGNVARGRLPAALPGFGITPMPIEGLAPWVTINDAEADLSLAIRFGMTKAQTEQGFRDTSYYLRAAVRSLRRFNGNSDPTKRQRNQIYLESCVEMRAVQLWDVIDDSVITGAVVAKYHIRDNAAT